MVKMQGTVIGIFVAPAAEAPIVFLDSAVGIPGLGLEGDRYYKKGGTFSDRGEAGRALTLIESEALEALERDYGIRLPYGEARRNIVTRGIALSHLVGKTFRCGSVLARGTRLCEPCSHLENISGLKVQRGLIHRGGLRADILQEGTIRIGDLLSAEE